MKQFRYHRRHAGKMARAERPAKNIANFRYHYLGNGVFSVGIDFAAAGRIQKIGIRFLQRQPVCLKGSRISTKVLIGSKLQRINKNTGHNTICFRAGSRYKGHYFFWYGHYYGVQAMYTAGGDFWKVYFERAREDLLALQRPSGEWPNDVGPGTAFSTATAILILEIPYRFLPIFQR
jgi:hypothetical protein